jgi:hypothetical protein
MEKGRLFLLKIVRSSFLLFEVFGDLSTGGGFFILFFILFILVYRRAGHASRGLQRRYSAFFRVSSAFFRVILLFFGLFCFFSGYSACKLVGRNRIFC